jgi:DNA polymerase-3 subunit epsilon
MKFEDVLKAPELEDIRLSVQEILNKYSITAFNISFDLGFLGSRAFRAPNELPCIMKTATNVVKIEAPWKDGPEKYKWPSCQEAWDFFFPNNDYIEKHRAADDAVHEAQILFEMYRHGQYPI